MKLIQTERNWEQVLVEMMVEMMAFDLVERTVIAMVLPCWKWKVNKYDKMRKRA